MDLETIISGNMVIGVYSALVIVAKKSSSDCTLLPLQNAGNSFICLNTTVILRQQQGQQPDLEEARERILSSLKVRKQALEYRRVKAVIERFLGEVPTPG